MPAPAADPKTVLVVEDDPWIQTFMEDTLADEGYAVVQALDGPAGLQLAARQHPDVILLDLALPGQSGLDMLHQLKRSQPTRAIPVIVVSAYTHRVAASDARHLDGVIQKPFDLAELLGQIKDATALRRSAGGPTSA